MRTIPSLRPATRYVLVPARETLPAAAREFKDQLCLLRGTPDELYVCRQEDGTPAFAWFKLTMTLDDIEGVLSVDKGGTGETTAEAAFWALAPAELLWMLVRRIEAMETALLVLGIDVTDDAWLGATS